MDITCSKYEHRTGNVCIMSYWSVFLQSLLQWKNYEYYTTCLCSCSPRYQHAMRICHIIMWSALLCNIFPHYLINIMIFEKKLLNLKCLFWVSLQPLSHIFCILRRIDWNIVNVHLSSCKIPIFLSYFNDTWVFSTEFWKILKYQISWKPFQCKPCCSMRMDRHAKLIVVFHHFANASN